MVRKSIFAILVVILAFTILFVSVMRATRIKFDINGTGNDYSKYQTHDIPYSLADPGNVLPGHFLWPVKAMRDRVWFIVTTDEAKKADLLLLLADKRLASAQELLDQSDYEMALISIVKAQRYLERAMNQEIYGRSKGAQTIDTLRHLSYASLKHYDVMNSMIDIFPDDVRVVIVESQKVPKLVYESSRDALLEKGVKPPENPFEW